MFDKPTPQQITLGIFIVGSILIPLGVILWKMYQDARIARLTKAFMTRAEMELLEEKQDQRHEENKRCLDVIHERLDRVLDLMAGARRESGGTWDGVERRRGGRARRPLP